MSRRKMGRKHGQGWHLTNSGWACTLGGRGGRVRLFEKRSGGGFWRAVWTPASNGARGFWRSRPLGTQDRTEAEGLGRGLLAELDLGRRPDSRESVRLGALWRRYQESPGFLANAFHTRADASHRAKCLAAFFGENRVVETLSRDDVAAYTAARLRGGLVIRNNNSARTLGPVGRRSAQADLKLLVTMLRWATTVVLADGRSRWLDRNPLDGVKLPREPAPRRPVATFERFERTVKATCQLEAAAMSDCERLRWQTLRCALTVAEATGRRLNAIRLLTWSDVDFAGQVIHWPVATDKMRVASTVALPNAAADALRAFQRSTGRIAGPIFTLPNAPDRVPSRHWFGWALREAEEAAGLPKLSGGLWHPLRRKWATERMHLPLKAVARAGGWIGTDTLVECYQQPDEAMLRAVMNEPRKVRESAG